jgi:AcrR family transcriptional regulator
MDRMATVAMSAPDPEDLTARARIRDAALIQFGEHGFERATIRGIAATAGVSSGLVRHHFGSKAALRQACDEYLSRTIRRLNDQTMAAATHGDFSSVAAARTSVGPYQRYLARALVEGWAAPLFDDMVQMCEQWLVVGDASRPDPPEIDRKARAAVITAMGLAIPILAQHVSRGLGVDISTPEGDQKLARALIDIYSHPMLSPEDAALARAGLDRVRRASTRADRGGALRQLEEHHDD